MGFTVHCMQACKRDNKLQIKNGVFCDFFISSKGLKASISKFTYGLQATNSSARPDVSIEQGQEFQTVRCLIGS